MSDINFIQIAVSDTDDGSTIVALDSEGRVYEYTGVGWSRLEGDHIRSAVEVEPGEEEAPDSEEEEEEEEEEEQPD
jgi:coproporphyrinogen III oxidase